MHSWSPRILIGLLLVLSWLPAAPAQAVNSPAIDMLVQQALDAWDVPGCAVVLVADDKVVYLKGFGVKERGKKDRVSPETVFPLGSCTKAFVATVMAQLVDEGKMKWDDPVRKHVAFFRLADPLADANVTLRDLLAHRTGLGSHDLLWYRSPNTPEETIRAIGAIQPSHSFRSHFEYQSIMYLAAGHAVGTATRGTWAEQAQARLVGPLGMKSIGYITAEAEKNADLASPHRKNRQGKLEVIPRYRLSRPNAAGSMHGNARDLGRWIQFQLGDGTSRGNRLVSAENLAETHTPQTVIRLDAATRALNPETFQMSYGLGWVIQDYRGQLLVSHAGAIDGFRADITLVPQARLGLAILANAHHTRMNLALSNNLVDLLLRLPARDWNTHFLQVIKRDEEAAAARAAERDQQRRKGTQPSLALAAYAGEYAAPAYGTARVELQDGKLVWQWSTFRAPLEHLHIDRFTVNDESLHDPEVAFALDGKGKVAAMTAFDVTFKKK